MARIRLLELKLQHEKKTGTKPINADIAKAVFKGEKDPPSASRQNSLLAQWNTGKETPSLDRLFRIAVFFKVTDLNQLAEP